MCRCIYCNSTDDLTVSDIISCALTGAKLTRKFVCRQHNSFTNDNFEKTAIANLAFFRSALGLTDRGGNEIKYRANITMDGITIPDISISGRASIYEDKKRLFHAEQDGKKYLIGNVQKLEQKQGVDKANIKVVNLSDTVLSVSFSVHKLLASQEMLHTVAKIAYEWYCYINDIYGYDGGKYQKIVDCILLNSPIEDVVEVVVDLQIIEAFNGLCNLGSHGLFEYSDKDGYKYVIYDFWGVILYKIRICPAEVSGKIREKQIYHYDIDGEKFQTTFFEVGTPHIPSLLPEEAIQQNHSCFVSKLEELLKTRVMTLRKLRALTDEIITALSKYKKTKDIAQFVDYESPERVLTIYLLELLKAHEHEYDFSKTFNENLKKILGCSEIYVTDEDKKRAYLEEIKKLHNEDQLIAHIELDIAFFEKIYASTQDN